MSPRKKPRKVGLEAASFRLDPAQVERLGRLVEASEKDPALIGIRVTRSAVLRRCLALGLDKLEDHYGIGTKTKRRR